MKHTQVDKKALTGSICIILFLLPVLALATLLPWEFLMDRDYAEIITSFVLAAHFCVIAGQLVPFITVVIIGPVNSGRMIASALLCGLVYSPIACVTGVLIAEGSKWFVPSGVDPDNFAWWVLFILAILVEGFLLSLFSLVPAAVRSSHG